MMLVTSWIANHIAGRLRRVQQQVARIADGDFHELDPGAHRDEVADLTLSINRMCASSKGCSRPFTFRTPGCSLSLVRGSPTSFGTPSPARA